MHCQALFLVMCDVFLILPAVCCFLKKQTPRATANTTIITPNITLCRLNDIPGMHNNRQGLKKQCLNL